MITTGTPFMSASINKVLQMPVIRVSWFNDKTDAIKAEVAAELTNVLVQKTGVDKKWVYVIFEDVKPTDWAVAGKIFNPPASSD
jgi:4-oxalocrotonate tautomerase